MKSVAELEAVLSTPSDRLIHDLTHIEGDIMLLGAGGKMGPSMAKLLVNATKAAGA